MTPNETLELRRALESAMAACGRSMGPDLDEEAFTGRLRRCMTTLSGGDDPIGFNYACTKTSTGDFAVTLAWEERHWLPSVPRVFSAAGKSETLAFLRAAEKVFQHDAYRKMLFGPTRRL
jgi:hypothetical protein